MIEVGGDHQYWAQLSTILFDKFICEWTRSARPAVSAVVLARPEPGTDCPANQALLHQNTSGVVDAMKQRRHALFFEVLIYSLSRSGPVAIIVNDENSAR